MGLLITFEGIDGSGKSTQAELLVERLRAEGYTTLLVREPGGTELSERVRDILLDSGLQVDPFAELLLFSAARAQLVAERVRPALEAGHVVICDRFFDSSTAYQGGGRELDDASWLRDFHDRVTGGLVPDRTYLVEVSIDVARARQSGTQDDRMEASDAAFYERVIAAYAQLAEAEPERIRRLDGGQSIDTLHKRIWADVEPRLIEHVGTPKSGNGSSDT